ncbi:MAG: hypothetical protein WD114_03200 [Phycisphaerales bacterium]
MLKFIRKYQLIILAVGGSLLMVVFLLEPVLTRLSPSPQKARIATLEDGSNINRGDIHSANDAINLLKRVNPRALGTRSQGGLGLDSSSEDSTALHWFLLVRQARQAGLVGGPGDGAAWIEEIARTEAIIQIQEEARQGLFQNEAQAEQRMLELAEQIIPVIDRNATIATGSRGGTMEETYAILAEARGVYRLLSAVRSLPAYSDVNAIHAAHELLDAVAVNAAVLGSDLVVSAIEDPSEQELQAFFESHAGQAPAEHEYGIGYVQPTRLQVGWLTLEKNTFMNAAEVDRVELNKIWRQNRDQYPGDFASERFDLERRSRDEQATAMMIEADRVIRSMLLARTNSLPKREGLLVLPDDWESQRPRLENMAQMVVERISQQYSISLPTPEVTIIGDRWLNANQIASLPGYGSAAYRLGSMQVPTYALPQFFDMTEPNTTGLDVQTGLPLVEPAATDDTGNRYYAVILDVSEAGPADSIEDVGRDRVVRDYKSVLAYQMLAERSDEFRAAIESNVSLAPAIDLALALAEDDTANRPGVIRNILVRRNSINPGALASTVDRRLETEAFRSAVLQAAQDLDPLATPEEIAADPAPVVVRPPASRSVAIALLIAPRPVTTEQFRQVARAVVASASQEELTEAGMAENDPFTFEALAERYGLTVIQKDEDTPPAPPADEAAEARGSDLERTVPAAG